MKNFIELFDRKTMRPEGCEKGFTQNDIRQHNEYVKWLMFRTRYHSVGITKDMIEAFASDHKIGSIVKCRLRDEETKAYKNEECPIIFYNREIFTIKRKSGINESFKWVDLIIGEEIMPIPAVL